MAVYMKYEGIDGEVTQKDHVKWIEVQSFQFGVGRGISTPTGSTNNRESSHASVSEVTVTKSMDGASPKLFTESAAGTTGKKVEINFVSTGDPGMVYAKYTLDDTLISGYSVSSGGDRPSESLSLNFTKVEFEMTPHDDKNAAGTPVRVSYDLTTAKKG
ncbi:Hcp family type VI secretion system effector [Mesorhizobium koreense]|jgi:type VI secretion system secreted protein Hcp|uniref:Hcp family type VI secretion system effector n=1 Tax=Mesorhizobium koreense TaxID=3074855 RepID=UPI00287BA481|nr:type VI secretion system tube protein Hcp [Mesorhizobium sp. WR6]